MLCVASAAGDPLSVVSAFSTGPGAERLFHSICSVINGTRRPRKHSPEAEPKLSEKTQLQLHPPAHLSRRSSLPGSGLALRSGGPEPDPDVGSTAPPTASARACASLVPLGAPLVLTESQPCSHQEVTRQASPRTSARPVRAQLRPQGPRFHAGVPGGIHGRPWRGGLGDTGEGSSPRSWV